LNIEAMSLKTRQQKSKAVKQFEDFKRQNGALLSQIVKDVAKSKSATQQLIASSSRRQRRVGKGIGGGVAALNRIRQGDSAPVITSTQISAPESMFSMKSVNHQTHGPGAHVAFSSLVANLSSNGVMANSDSALPFNLATLSSSLYASGFVSVDATHSSGIKMHPDMFGKRMQRETLNWNRYLWKWFKLTYVSTCGSSQPGNLTIAFARDPNSFFEAAGTQLIPEPDFMQLTQQIPFAANAVWKNFGLKVVNKETDLKYTLIADNSYPFTENLGTMAYNDQIFFGRIAGYFQGNILGSVTPYGQLWIEGEIEFYNPSSSYIVLGTLSTPSILSSEKTEDKKSKMRNNLFCRSLKSYFSLPEHVLDYSSDPFNKDLSEPIESKSSVKLEKVDSPVPIDWELDEPVVAPVSRLKGVSLIKSSGGK